MPPSKKKPSSPKTPPKRPLRAWPRPRPTSARPPLAARPSFLDTLVKKAKAQPHANPDQNRVGVSAARPPNRRPPALHCLDR
jgi:hypothetical protein